MHCSVSEQLQFSEVLVKWRRFFNFLAALQGKSEMMVLEQKLELEQLKVCLCECCRGTIAPKIFVSKLIFSYVLCTFSK